MALKAVSLSYIPGGTPLKDLVKFRAGPLSRSAAEAVVFPSAVLTSENVYLGKEAESKRILQSTLVAGGIRAEGLLDFSEIKPSSQQPKPLSTCVKQEDMPLTRSAVLKRKACEPLPMESPAKIFSRMKTRAALARQQQTLLENKLLAIKSTTDYIITPERHRVFFEGKKLEAGSEKPKEPLAKELFGDTTVEKGLFFPLENVP